VEYHITIRQITLFQIIEIIIFAHKMLKKNLTMDRKRIILKVMFLVMVLGFLAYCNTNDKSNQSMNIKNKELVKTENEDKANNYSSKLIANKQFLESEKEKIIKTIRKRYYSLTKENLDSEISENYEAGIKRKVVVSYDFDLDIKKIVVEFDEGNKTNLREYCYENNSLYFVFGKIQNAENINGKIVNRFIENRFYLNENVLVQTINKEYLIYERESKPKEKKELDSDNSSLPELFDDAYNLLFKLKNAVANRGFTKTIKKDDYLFPSFAIIHHGYLVLDDCFDYELEGKPYIPKGGGMAMCDINHESVPSYYKNLVNKKFMVFDKNNNNIEVKLLSFHVLVDFTPHFGEIQQWNSSEISDEEIANEIFYGDRGPTLLVAEIDKELDYKAEYAWAQLTALSKDDNVGSANDEFLFIAEESVYSSSEFKSIEQEYLDYQKNSSDYDFPDRWEDYAEFAWADYGTDKINITFYKAESGEPCGQESFEASISSLFIAKEKNNIKENDVIEISNEFGIPLCAFDLENDGYPEFLFRHGIEGYRVVKYTDGELITIWEIEIPFYDCPC